jgi:hypothetical protein
MLRECRSILNIGLTSLSGDSSSLLFSIGTEFLTIRLSVVSVPPWRELAVYSVLVLFIGVSVAVHSVRMLSARLYVNLRAHSDVF